MALYVDRGLAQDNLTAAKCHVACVFAPAVPNPDMNDETDMTSEEQLEDERL